MTFQPHHAEDATMKPVAASKCELCNRDPKRMNSIVAECSHPSCTHRRNPWTAPTIGPRDATPKNTEADPMPLDRDPEIIN
jgi:hypothetical protein